MIKKYLSNIWQKIKDFSVVHRMIISILLLFVGIFLITYGAILEPSIKSVNNYYSCKHSDIIAKKAGGGYYSPSKDLIVNYEKPGSISYKMVQLHELCHRIQHYENRSLYNTKRGAFINEVECNIESWKFWRWHTV